MLEYYSGVLETIRMAMDSIDEEQYRELVDECEETLRRGGKIIASGLGKNVPICEKFVGTMNSAGIDARFLHTNTAVHGDLGMISENDIVFLLSKGGNTYETVALAQYLKERGTNTWLLSFTEKCKTTEYVDKNFIMKLRNEGDMWDIMPNNSTTIYLIVLQGIAIELCKRMGVTLDDFKKNHPGGGIGARLRGEDLWR
ncbi:SIS domain-containing protein [Butyrivibrio sp. INlla14]|uniref:SIS domain-containing protein n=1 Tax=Butyrivibrio sp. INlla14 TaxID=1520808 RepID=UPI00087664BB|nr:SIS domain-containing protein [Butyrivibrio sp. INlla14]SCY71517.1 arabinose-5-phosphate isomerase [Butyrivibrio sp. INlla14]